MTTEDKNNHNQEKGRWHHSQAMLATIRAGLRAPRCLTDRILAMEERLQVLRDKVVSWVSPNGNSARILVEDPGVAVRWRIFWAIVLLATMMDYLASGHIGEALAQMVSPLCGRWAALEDVEIALRHIGVFIFVAAMLGLTLGVKYCAAAFLHRARIALPGLTLSQRIALPAAYFGVFALKVAYLVLLGSLYLYLYGFAEEYALQSAGAANVSSMLSEQAASKPVVVNGVLTFEKPSTENPSPEKPVSDAASKIAGAPRVYYIAIAMIHMLLLFFPSHGFGQFRHEIAQSKYERKISRITVEQDRLLREVALLIRTAPLQTRQEIIDETEPVHSLINRMFGREVIVVNRAIGTTPIHVQPEDPPMQDSQPETLRSEDYFEKAFGKKNP